MFSNPVYTTNAETKQQPSSEESGEGQLLDISEYSVDTSLIEDNKPKTFKNEVFDRRTPSPMSRRKRDETPTKQDAHSKAKNPDKEAGNSGFKAQENDDQGQLEQQTGTSTLVKDLITKFGKKDTKNEPPKNPQASKLQTVTDERRGSVRDLIKRFEKPQQENRATSLEREILGAGGAGGGIIANRIQELQKKIEDAKKEKHEQELWEKQKEERLQQQREIRATFMMQRGDDPDEQDGNQKKEHQGLQRMPSESDGRSENDVKSRLLEDSSDDLSKSYEQNATPENKRTQNPFGFQIRAPTEAEHRSAQSEFRPTANFDTFHTQETKHVSQTQTEHEEKFSLMTGPTKSTTAQQSGEAAHQHFGGGSQEKAEQIYNPFTMSSNPFSETSNPFATNSNPFGITSTEEDMTRPSGNFGFFQGNKSPVGHGKHQNEASKNLNEEEYAKQIIEEEEESKLDKSDVSLVLNRDALDKWRYKMDRRRNYPAEEVEADLIDMDNALSILTDASQDLSHIGVPVFRNKFYEKDKDNSFYLNMSKLHDNSMISQVGDSSMVKDKKNRSQILDAEIKLIDLDASDIDQDLSYSKSKNKKNLVKPLKLDRVHTDKSESRLNDSNVVTKAERIKDEARQQANMNESYVFSKIDKLFDEGKDLDDLNESKHQLLEDMDRSRNRIFTDRLPEDETDRTDLQKELEFFDRLLDISQIQQNQDGEFDPPTTMRGLMNEKMFSNEVFNRNEHSNSPDEGTGEKHKMQKKSRLRNPDQLNISTNEGTMKKQKGSNKLDTTAPLDESVDIEELKKGVPTYNLAFSKEVTQEKPTGRGEFKKSRPRNPNAGNVSFNDKADKEGNIKLDTTAPLYPEGNVDKEDLKKGIPVTKSHAQKVLQEQVSENPQRKTKLRDPSALNVSTFEAQANPEEGDISAPFAGLNKSVDMEELRKGVPDYKQKQQEKAVKEDNSHEKSKLRNPDALNVSAFEARKNTNEDEKDQHGASFSFDGLNKSVHIEDLKKGVPEYKVATKVVQDDSKRRSKLRNADALNVSTFEAQTASKEDEGGHKHDLSAPFEGLNKSVDIEDLRKGVPEYKTKGKEVQALVEAQDNSNRRSKVRNPEALNVSTFEGSKNKNEDDEDRHGASFSYEGLNKSVNIEDLKKGVPQYSKRTEMVVVEDNSKRRSKIRGTDTLNVSTFEAPTTSKDQEGNKNDISAPFEGLNKSVDMEELRKGVPEYKTIGTELQAQVGVEVEVEDNSKRRSKVRNPEALNVSTFDGSASSKGRDNKLDTSTPLNPLDQGINVEDLKKGLPASVLPKNLLKGSEEGEKSESPMSAESQNVATVNESTSKKKRTGTKTDAKSFIDDLVKQNFNKEDLKSSFSLLNRSVDLKHDINKSLLDDHLNKSYNIPSRRNVEKSEADGRLLQESEEVSIVSQGRRPRPKRPQSVLQQQPAASESEIPEVQQKKRNTEIFKNPFPTSDELKRIRSEKKSLTFKFYKQGEGVTKFAMRSHGRFMFNQPVDVERIDSQAELPSVTDEGLSRITVPHYITKDNKTKFGSADKRRRLFGFKVKPDVMFRARKDKQVNRQVFCSGCEEFIRFEESNSHASHCEAGGHLQQNFSQQLPTHTLSELNKRILAIVNKNSKVLEEFNVRPQFSTICKRLGEISIPAADETTTLDKLNTLMRQFDNVFASLAELELQEDELDMIIYLQRLFVSLQDKADLLKHGEHLSDPVQREFKSGVLKELQDKDVRQKDYFKLKTKPSNLHRIEAIDSDIASSVDTEMTFVGSEVENWVEYEPRSNSKDKESNRRHFYIQSVNIKLALPASHPAREIVISKLYDKAVKEKIPKELWSEFIKKEFRVEF